MTDTVETPTLEGRAIELIDDAQAGLGALTNRLGELAVQYGPEVVDAALNVARVSAAKPLVAGFGILVLATILGVTGIRLFQTGRKDNLLANEKAGYSNVGEARMAFGGACAVAGVVSLIISGTLLLNIWNWVGIFAPELWIAHRVLGW